MFQVVYKIIRPIEGISLEKHKENLSQVTDIIENECYELKRKITMIDNILGKYKGSSKPNRQDFIFNKLSGWFHEYILSKQSELNNSFSMLDIGGGNGYILSKFGEKYGLNAKNLVCLENKSDNTEFAYDYNLPNIKYCFDPDILLNEEDKFNIIICMVSLHHMTNQYISEVIIPLIKIKLKDNGLLLIKEHDAYCSKIIERIHWEHHLYKILDTCGSVNVDTYLNNYIGNYKSKYELETMLEESGFKYLYTFSNIFDNVNKSFSGEENKTPTKLYWQLYKNAS